MAFDKWTELRKYVEAVGGGGHILNRMNMLDAEEARLKPPAPTLKPGDKVRHIKFGGKGNVVRIAKSGRRAYVQWPGCVPAYYEIGNLELVEEAPQS